MLLDDNAVPTIGNDDVFLFFSECTFGKQIRELGSTWFADLGPPFGVMYCIKCECIPVRVLQHIFCFFKKYI